MKFPVGRIAKSIGLALTFLTVIPVRVGKATDSELAAARYAFPLVGALIGLMLAAMSLGLDRIGAPPGVAAFLLVATGAALTGGLHLDGLADSADGLFLWGDAERRLAVMREPHIGSYGVLAVVLVLLGRFAALGALTGPRRALGLLGAAVVSRSLLLVAAGCSRYARPDGTGRIIIDATTPRDALAAAGLIVATGLLCNSRIGLVGGCALLMLAVGLVRLASRRLGGITGDILGALVELGDLVYLIVLTL